MKFVGLVSGGKDSCFNILHCMANGHELIALANLYPANLAPGNEELDSFMYQTVGFPAVAHYGDCLQVPLYREEIRGSAKRTSLDYEQTQDDESEDLFRLLSHVKASHPDLEAVSVGAILSTYQRLRVENVCRRLGIVSLAYLWLRDQAELLHEMTTQSHLDIRLIKAAGIGLNSVHVGQPLVSLVPLLTKLNTQYGFHLCGEGGEYETLVLDGPDCLFKKRLVVEKTSIVEEPSGDVCYACIQTAVQDKDSSTSSLAPEECVVVPPLFEEEYLHEIEGYKNSGTILPCPPLEPSTAFAPFTPKTLHASTDASSSSIWITNLSANTGDVAADVRNVLQMLESQLAAHGFTRKNVAFVSLLVKDLTPQSFGYINSEYSTFFSHSGPPARFCISPCSPSTCPFTIQISALATTVAKESLHVESVSYWAPANIGPYSQCMALSVDSVDEGMLVPHRLGLLSGQIGLVPRLMTLSNDATEQALLSFQHLVRVSKAASTPTLLGAVAYVTNEQVAQVCYNIWTQYIGNDDSLIICLVSALPRNAQVEWSGWGSSSTLCHGWKVQIARDTSNLLAPPDDYQLVAITSFVSSPEAAANGPIEIIPVDRIWYQADIVPRVAYSISIATSD